MFIYERNFPTPILFTEVICGARNTISSSQDHTLRHLREVSALSGIGVLSYGIVCRLTLSRLQVKIYIFLIQLISGG